MTNRIHYVPGRQERGASHVGLVGFALICGLGWAAVLVTNDAALPIILPMLAMLAVVGLTVIFLWDRRAGTPSLFEIGAVYVAVVALYTVYPLLGFLVNGLSYTRFNDARMFAAQPAPEEIGIVAWYHVAHAASFLMGYVLVRGRRSGEGVRRLHVARPTILTVVLLYVAIAAFFFFLRLSFDMAAENYAESFLVSQRLPLVLAQLLNHLHGILFTLELVILAALFANYERYRLVIAGWIAAIGVTTFMHLWSRSALMLLLLAALIMYHRTVRPIPVRTIAVVSLVVLGGFGWLGQLRAGHQDEADAAGVNPVFGHSSEFEVIFSNAYDLRRLLTTGDVGDIPPSIHFSEVLAFIPQQISPIVKVDPGAWYVSSFYPVYAEGGGGLAFGAIPQSLLGGGWISLVVRAAMLGLLLGLVHRYWVWHATNLWTFVFYIWATVLVYHSFRNVTFILVVLFVYRCVPVWLAVKVLSAVMMKTSRTWRT